MSNACISPPLFQSVDSNYQSCACSAVRHVWSPWQQLLGMIVAKLVLNKLIQETAGVWFTERKKNVFHVYLTGDPMPRDTSGDEHTFAKLQSSRVPDKACNTCKKKVPEVGITWHPSPFLLYFGPLAWHTINLNLLPPIAWVETNPVRPLLYCSQIISQVLSIRCQP